jgi:hypothetical protein
MLRHADSDHIWLNILSCRANDVPEIMKCQDGWLNNTIKIAYVHSLQKGGSVKIEIVVLPDG